MNTCNACGTQQPVEGAYCIKCGKKISNDCLACHLSVPDIAEYCPHCGAKLAKQKDEPSELSPTFQEPNLTFLVVDIHESTSLMRKQDIEKARDWLEKIVELMISEIVAFQGKVLQYTGDGLLASFHSKNHGLQACFAAAKLQKVIRESDAHCHTRVGLHSTRLKFANDEELLNSLDLKVTQIIEGNAPLDGIQVSFGLVDAFSDHLLIGGQFQVDVPELPLPVACFTLRAVKPEAEKLVLYQNISESDALQAQEISKSHIEGVRKVLTCFFIKVVGESIVHTDNHEKHNTDIISFAIRRFGGTVIKQTRETLFAIFGAPVSFEDHALRACLAAHAIQQEVIEGGVQFIIHVGIHTGEAIIDKIGAGEFRRYDAIGSAVNFAARLMQTASNNQIQLSRSTTELVSHYTKVISVGKKTFKGFDDSVNVYALLGLQYEAINRQMEVRFYAGSVYLGREKELGIVQSKWGMVLRGQSQMLAVKADAGMGKTRLLYEFSQQAIKKGGIVYSVSSSGYEKNDSFATLLRFLKNMFSINPVKLSMPQLNMVNNRLKTIPFTDALSDDAILALLGAEVKNPAWVGLAPILQRQILFNSIVEMLRHESIHAPLIVIFEDLHWCDSDTLEFINHLLKWDLQRKIFIMIDYRPEFDSANRIEPDIQEIILGPLSDDVCFELLNTLLPGGEDLKQLQKLILNDAHGNPFFIEEHVKSAISSNKVQLGEGGYHLLEGERIEEVPHTIKDIVSSRIDQLLPEYKCLLQQASVLGRVFPVTYLRYLSELSNEEFSMALEVLKGQGFLIEAALIPEPECAFKHVYILESVYNSMLKNTRKSLHKKLFEEIEARHQEGLSPFYSMLAHHAYLSQLWAKSIYYYDLMMPGAISLNFALSQYILIGPIAEECFDHMSEGDKEKYFSSYGRIMLLYYRSLFFTLKVEETIEGIEALMIKSVTYNHLFTELFVRALYVAYNAISAKSAQMHKLCKEIIDLVDKAIVGYSEKQTKDLKASVYFCLAHPPVILGYFEEFDRLAELLNRVPIDLQFVSYYTGIPTRCAFNLYIAICNSIRARVNVLQNLASNLETVVDTLNVSENQALTYLSIFYYYYTIGDFEKAGTFVTRSIECYEAIKMLTIYPLATSFYSVVLFYSGQRKASREMAKKSLDLYQSSEYVMGFAVPSAAEMLALGGAPQEAIIIIEDFLSVIEADDQKPLMAQSYRIKALAYNLMAKDSAHNDEILKLLDKAREITDEIDCRMQRPFICLNYAQFYRRVGQLEKAEGEYQRALAYFEQYEMQGWYAYYKTHGLDPPP